MKNRNPVAIRCIVLLFIAASSIPVAAQENGADIMQRVMDAQSAGSCAMDIRLTLIEPNGDERERRIQTLTMTDDGLTSTITLFLSPASVRNTRFLTRQRSDGSNDQWMYLPALGRGKRIAAGEGGGSFMGSDFTYADMASTTYDADEAVHTVLRDDLLDSRETSVVESIPTGDSDYGKTVTWVDKTTDLPLRVEFYEKNRTTLRKTLAAGDITRVGDRWTTGVITMTTLASGHSTRIEILQVKYDIPIHPGYFTTTFLETGRL